MRRTFEIILSVSALLVMSPLLAVVIIALKFTGEGEVFFRQQRVGLKGEMFDLLKFATMLKNSPNIYTGTVTVKDDPRVLPVGRILRKTKINEIPQLINVLVGDMSLVGPRPQTQRCFDAFPFPAQEEIKKVRPGLSGLGSIIFRAEENMMEASADPDFFYDEVIMPYKGAVECWYVQHETVSVYVKCIIVTIWVVVFSRSGAVWWAFRDLPRPPDELARLVFFEQV